jgi:hypothetical protein
MRNFRKRGEGWGTKRFKAESLKFKADGGGVGGSARFERAGVKEAGEVKDLKEKERGGCGRRARLGGTTMRNGSRGVYGLSIHLLVTVRTGCGKVGGSAG